MSNSFIELYRKRIEQELTHRFDNNSHLDKRLNEAMRYSLLDGGKRVRGLLVYASAFAVNPSSMDSPLTHAAAASLECIHAYSLIHDDLPAMDDDDLRRGKPSCHRAFDEATAILAGDAMQTLAFEWLSEPNLTNDEKNIQLKMVHRLATASGNKGMGAGQSIDLSAVNQSLDLDQLTHMHQLKTGALISASVYLGALSALTATEYQISALEKYAYAIGIAFQIQDDILDVTTDTDTLGKQQGSDVILNKPTFVSILGLHEAQVQANSYFKQALSALSNFDQKAKYLHELAEFIVKRPH